MNRICQRLQRPRLRKLSHVYGLARVLWKALAVRSIMHLCGCNILAWGLQAPPESESSAILARFGHSLKPTLKLITGTSVSCLYPHTIPFVEGTQLCSSRVPVPKQSAYRKGYGMIVQVCSQKISSRSPDACSKARPTLAKPTEAADP